MIIGSVLEFVLGNTFPFVVFGTFGAFWLTIGGTLTPQYNAAGAYDPKDPTNGSSTPMFNASFGFFHLYMGLLCLIYLICSLRTNIIFMGIFVLLVPSFGCLAGAYWQLAKANVSLATTLLHAAGGMTFVVCLLGWYLFFVQLLASVDFPLNLPVGDLGRFIRGASDRKKAE